MQGIIEILREEHDEILKFIVELREKCVDFMEHDTMEMEYFRNAVSFIRNFADKAHHQKEEKILFQAMMERLGTVAVNLIQHGMLVEHDLARLHVMELENALNAYEKEKTPENKLDIIANAVGYCYLLKRHVDKENAVVYPYAEKNLSADVMKQLDEEAVRYMEQLQNS